MIIKKLLFYGIFVLPWYVAYAQTSRIEIQQNKCFSAANYLAYQVPPPNSYSPAPQGYQPFYISTYARHGSRFHLSEYDYVHVLTILQKADSAGVLSTTGKKTMEKINRIRQLANGRLGELTPLGARQHRGIAERMYHNFPEIFSGNTVIDARSTNVVRCILSMTAECLQLQALNPQLRIYNDASLHDMYYMNYHDKYLASLHADSKAELLKAFKQQHIHPERLMKVLFTDTVYIQNTIHPSHFMEELFYITINMQSHDEKELDLYHLFTPKECYELWSCLNVLWYLDSGDTPLTERMMPYKEANLLRNILDTADSCIVREEPSATLRFGHESCLLPLAVLMELGDCGYVTEDMETLAEHWQCYQYFPMASNIQLIFYRKSANKDILVRVLLNEKETSLPVKTDCAPFYHWHDVSKYYRNKLTQYTPTDK